jgi:hypothetical protein
LLAAILGGSTMISVAAVAVPPTAIPLTVVTSSGEPVVGVIVTAVDETDVHAPPRGCGTDEITPTDAAGHCTFYNMTSGHLYSIWLQGYPVTGSGDARPAFGVTYQPIILTVTGRLATPPSAHGGGTGLTGRALTSSGEYLPGIGVCATAGNPDAGVTCVQADGLGNYSVSGCCDVRVIGYLAGSGGPYVNGSVRHAPTGAPATIVVLVGPAIASTPTATPQSTAAPTTSGRRVPTLAQTGQGSSPILLLALTFVAAGCVLRLLGARSGV